MRLTECDKVTDKAVSWRYHDSTTTDDRRACGDCLSCVVYNDDIDLCHHYYQKYKRLDTQIDIAHMITLVPPSLLGLFYAVIRVMQSNWPQNTLDWFFASFSILLSCSMLLIPWSFIFVGIRMTLGQVVYIALHHLMFKQDIAIANFLKQQKSLDAGWADLDKQEQSIWDKRLKENI